MAAGTNNFRCHDLHIFGLHCFETNSFFIRHSLYQMSDVVESEVMQSYLKPHSQEESKPQPSKGFVVRDAPWTATGNNEKVRLYKDP